MLAEQTNRRPLIPIRARVGAELSATLATHTRPKRRHGNIIAKVIDVHDRLVPACRIGAIDYKRSHAVGAHVAEGHWLAILHF
jgi:hypothetical protein